MSKFLIHRLAFTGAAIPLALMMMGTAHAAKVVNIPVPKAAVVSAFNTALEGTRVHVHNLGKRHGKSWLDDQSYVLPPTGKRYPFKVREFERRVAKARKRTLMYYVRDFNSSALNAYADGNRIKLVIQFESQGKEIAGKCVRRAGVGKKKHWKECGLKMERDIHLNNARLEVSLVPTNYNGSISYKSPKASFHADIKIANRLCKAFKGICGWIEGKIKKSLLPKVAHSAVGALNNSKLKQRVAKSVRKALIGKIRLRWKVIGVRSSGKNFIVTVQRP